jgi:predicted NBD/HSP70 family sugar kinase
MTEHANLKSLWLSQDQKPFAMSVSEIHARAERFQGRIRTRNVIEYGAAAFSIVAFGVFAIILPDPIIRIGVALIVAGLIYVCWKLSRLGRAARDNDRARAASIAAFHQSELVRQRAALASVWRWYIAPLVPGLVVFVAGVTLAIPAPISEKLNLFGTTLGFAALVFAAVIWLNGQAVKRIDAELAALREVAEA